LAECFALDFLRRIMVKGVVAAASPPALAPCQEAAIKQVLAAVKAGAPLVELRGPSGRGHGITSALRSLAGRLGDKAVMIDISATLGAEHPEKILCDLASKHLEAGDVVIIDDIDVAARPQKIRASRNAGDQFRGAGNFAFEDPPEPLRVLKALHDRADALGGSVVFSTVEEGHTRYMQVPVVVRMEAATSADLGTVLKALAPHIQAESLISSMIVAPTIAEVKAAVFRARSMCPEGGSAVGAEELKQALRANLDTDAAVPTEEVEHIDLNKLPGMGKIVKTLETHVLFPILHPEEAQKQGLMPKRGVLLHGAPGTGKTTIGRALAHRLKGRFFMIRELLLYKEIFEVFAQARAAAPSVVFFDDIDVLLGGLNGLVEGARGHDLTRFLLSQMDGLRTTPDAQVVVVMAAADAKFLPPAILRSGRIELWLKTEKPKTGQRKVMIQHYVDKADKSASPESQRLLRDPLELEDVTRKCEDFVPADLRRIVCDARNASAAEGAKRSGGEYLKEAAADLKAMKEDVEGIVGRMYM